MSDILISVGLKEGTEKLTVTISEDEFEAAEAKDLGFMLRKAVMSMKLAELSKNEHE